MEVTIGKQLIKVISMKAEEKSLENFGGLIKILKNGNRVVTFSSCEITQETIEFMAKSINIDNLLFYYCDFKEINLSHLNKSNVTALSSMHGNFNNEHLKQLAAIASFKTIKLHGSKVSKDAIQQFLYERPDVKLI